MGADNATAVLARTKVVIEAVTDAGKALVYTPGWTTADHMEAAGLVTLASGVQEHRFWIIEHEATRDEITNQSDLVLHTMTLLGWIAAKQDKDQFEASTAEAIALKSAVVGAFDSALVAFPSIAGEPMTYEEDGKAEEGAPMEFRELLKRSFHLIQIRIAPREEITRGP